MKQFIKLYEEHQGSSVHEVQRLRQLGIWPSVNFKTRWSTWAHGWIDNWRQDQNKERESANYWLLSDGRYLIDVSLEPPIEIEYLGWEDCVIRLTFNDESTAIIKIHPDDNNARVEMTDLSIGRTLNFSKNISSVINQVERTGCLLEEVLDWFNSEWTSLTKNNK